MKACWQSVRLCDQWDIVPSNGLAVSPLGEFVALGSWGCGTAYDNLVVWRGVGGCGSSTPVLQHSLPGEIWGVDVDVGADNKTVYVGAGSWHTESDPSQVVLFVGSL